MSTQTTSKRAGFVAIVGRPNSGKSTLLNRVLGAKVSIVSPKAQTTRERVLGILTEKNEQIVFVDTPGIHKAKPGGFNAYMVREAAEAVTDVSVIWYLVDPNSGLRHEQAVIDLLAGTKAPVIVLLNKADVRRTPRMVLGLGDEVEIALRAKGVRVEAVHSISARTGRGVEILVEETFKHLPESEFYFEDPDQVSDRPVRFFVGEKIREQLYLCLGEELPYSCAVSVDKFDEKSDPPRVEATIYVERDSQKGMVIGKGGLKIKEIGSNARKEAQAFLGHPIFLGLNVKVLPDWTRDRAALKKLGYNLPKEARK